MKYPLALLLVVAVLSLSGCNKTRHTDGSTSTNNRDGDASVVMSMQENEFFFQCTHVIGDTGYSPSVSIKASYNPNMTVWQKDVSLLERLTTVYGNPNPRISGNDPNIVDSGDVTVAVERILASYHETLCLMAKKKTLAELLNDTGLYHAKQMNTEIATNKDRHFDISVSLTRVVLAEDFLRGLALKGLSAIPPVQQPPKPKPKAVVKPKTLPPCAAICQASPGI